MSMTGVRARGCARRLARQQQQRFAVNNQGMAPAQRPMMRRPKDRNAGVITEEEWEEGVEQHVDNGKGFRRLFWIFVGVCIVFLAFSKYDMEEGIDLPPELQKLAARDAETAVARRVTSVPQAFTRA